MSYSVWGSRRFDVDNVREKIKTEVKHLEVERNQFYLTKYLRSKLVTSFEVQSMIMVEIKKNNDAGSCLLTQFVEKALVHEQYGM